MKQFFTKNTFLVQVWHNETFGMYLENGASWLCKINKNGGRLSKTSPGITHCHDIIKYLGSFACICPI